MIIPEKSGASLSSPPSSATTSPNLSALGTVAHMGNPFHKPQPQPSDTQSVMSQDPPPYSEPGPSALLTPPPEVIRPTQRQAPPRHPSQSPPQKLDSKAYVPPKLARRSIHSSGPLLSPEPGPSHFTMHPSVSQTQLAPADPRSQSHSRRKSLPDLPPAQTSGALVPYRHPAPAPRATFPPVQNPPSSPNQNSLPSPTSPVLGRRCNYYSEHSQSSSLRGAYHLDMALEIPESLRPPMTEFHGFWNEMDKKAVKAREKERKAREKAARGGWGRKKVVLEPLPEKRLANEGVRPNLMLASKDGGVQAEVSVSPGPTHEVATVVAESNDGSVKLTLNDPSGQGLRIFAISMDGSVRVRIPPTFQGAIWMTTEDGSVHLSEGIKSRLMVFSRTTKTLRGYIGDWQSTQFGRTPSSGEEPDHAFKTWTGPLAHIYARDGSVHLSLTGEDTSSTFSRAVKSFYNGIVGATHEDEEAKERREQWAQQIQQDPRMVWQARSLEVMHPRMGLTGLFPAPGGDPR